MASDSAANQAERAGYSHTRAEPERLERRGAALQTAGKYQRSGQKNLPDVVARNQAVSTTVVHVFPLFPRWSKQARKRRDECSQRDSARNGRIPGTKTVSITNASAPVITAAAERQPA
ncbi:hypothetical protein [Paraburkholderia caffeinilytica]|uniref:hypothetical protein n=1 Tax=Paraburkholderia caffeinilytica TaxID=1761016 RepID=UPI003DA05624